MTDFSAPGWEIVQRVRQRGVTAIQWDGGADYAIHGRWTRELPGFNLQDMYLVPEHLTCELRLTVVADGFNRVVRLPVEIIGPDQQPVALTSPPSQTALTPWPPAFSPVPGAPGQAVRRSIRLPIAGSWIQPRRSLPL